MLRVPFATIFACAVALSLLPSYVHAKKREAGANVVVVLGDSRTDGCEGQPEISECRKSDLGFNVKMVNQLLSLVAQKSPLGVFFTGDLTLGLEREEEDDTVDDGALPAAGSWSHHFEYSSATFHRMIAAFQDTAAKALGTIPFHAVVGNHDSVGPDAIDMFRAVFNIKNGGDTFSDPSHLAYTVVVGDAAFVVLATDYYKPCPADDAKSEGKGKKSKKQKKSADDCNLQEHAISDAQLAWLGGELDKYKGKHLFVVTHEPAFSYGKKKVGLDVDEKARDAFWAILEQHKVTALLCSHQHMFEVSRHGAVWQVISGGAGAPLDGTKKATQPAPDSDCTGGLALDEEHQGRSFFHYLLLTIPAPGKAPHGEVRDCTDKVRSTFDLTQN